MSIVIKTDGIDVSRFGDAMRRVAMEEKLSEGFSVYSEGAVHKAVKLYVDPDPDHHEVPLLGSIVDVFNESGVTEVQTGSFTPLLPKLRKLLDKYPVTVLHPFPIRTAHRWLDKETGEMSTPKNKGRHKSPYSVAAAVFGIRELIGHPNLKIRILAYEREEFRALDGRGKTRKRGATMLGRLPTRLVGEYSFAAVSDIRDFIPEGLSKTFTQKEYLKAIKSHSRYDTIAIKLLEYFGVVRKIGKQGRAYLYEITPQNDN